MNKKFSKILENFKNKKIGVIGDLMLDQFIWGQVTRISPEAPIPVVSVEKESLMPGGAANAANNIVSLGGKVSLLGIVGKDEAGQKLIEELKKRKIDTKGIFQTLERPTTLKIRIIARDQHIVRVDKENNCKIKKSIENKVIDFINSSLQEWDAILISDYQKGFVTENLAKKIINLAKKNKKPIICDTKSKNILHFKNITLLTPNHHEAMLMTGFEDVRKAARIIQKKLNCNVLITQGADGMTLFENYKFRHLPAITKRAFDITGAGDTVTAVITLAIAAGANLLQAAQLSNLAAGIVVKKLGTATVSLNELKKYLKNETL